MWKSGGGLFAWKYVVGGNVRSIVETPYTKIKAVEMAITVRAPYEDVRL